MKLVNTILSPGMTVVIWDKMKKIPKKRIAIFDIDGTIFRSSLLIELVRALLQEGIFPSSVEKIYAKTYKNWLDRKDTYEKYLEGVIKAFNQNIKGVGYKDFLRVAQKAIVFHKNRVYRYTRDLVRDLKRKEYYLLAISHSPKVVLDNFCKKWGFHKIYGKMYELDKQRRFTGRILHLELINNKAKILKRLIGKEKLTLKGSIGVGDTESDIAFLKLVERPICFNPNKKLYQYAKRRGWEIVVERKDVVYHF